MPPAPGAGHNADHPAASAASSGRPWLLAVLAIAVVAAWPTPLLYPLKVFTVLLHELGHGAAAVLTGGSIERIELSADLGGACWSRGGFRPLVLAAGYLGSMTFGGLILLASARVRRDELLAGVLGAAVVVLALIFVRTIFGLVFGLAFGLVLLAAARWLSPAANDLLLKLLGVTSMLYAVIDIKEDLINRTVPGSDAWAMSGELFLPPAFWGVLWMSLALISAVGLVRLAVRLERRH